MKKTKQLNNQEYNGIPLSFPDYIQKHVNMEEKKWYRDQPELPKSKVEAVKIKGRVPMYQPIPKPAPEGESVWTRSDKQNSSKPAPTDWEEEFDGKWEAIWGSQDQYDSESKAQVKSFIRSLIEQAYKEGQAKKGEHGRIMYQQGVREERERISNLIQTHNFMEINIHRGIEDLLAKIKNNG